MAEGNLGAYSSPEQIANAVRQGALPPEQINAAIRASGLDGATNSAAIMGMLGGQGGGGQQSRGTGMSQEQLLRSLLTGQADYQAAPEMLGELGMQSSVGTSFPMTALEGLIGSAQQGAPPEPGGPPVGGYQNNPPLGDLFMGLVQETVSPDRRNDLMRGLLGKMEEHKAVVPQVDRAISGWR